MIAKTILGDPFFYPAQFVDSLSDVLRDDPIDVMKIDVFYSNEDECDDIVETMERAFPEISLTISDGKNRIVAKKRFKTKRAHSSRKRTWYFVKRNGCDRRSYG